MNEITIQINMDHVIGLLGTTGAILAAVLPYMLKRPDPIRKILDNHETRLKAIEEWRSN